MSGRMLFHVDRIQAVVSNYLDSERDTGASDGPEHVERHAEFQRDACGHTRFFAEC